MEGCKMEVGEDGVAVITISNPPVNAISVAVANGLKEKYSEAMQRNDVKAMVLTGGNGKFCAGLDISYIQEIHETGDISILPDTSFDLVYKEGIEDGKKPCVAAIQGFALGGGLELALGCSARIAASGSVVGLPELKFGIIPGCGGTQRFPRLVGISKAIDILFSSKPITCEEGKDIGLIDAVVPADELLAASRRWALDIVEGRRSNADCLQQSVSMEDAKETLENARKLATKNFPNMPNYGACIDVIEHGLLFGPKSGFLMEEKISQETVMSKTAKSLTHVYFSEAASTKVQGITDCGFKAKKIEKVGVVGGGLMGSGIATALLVNNINVILKEVNHECLQKAIKAVHDNIQGLIQKGQKNLENATSLLKGVLDYEDFKSVDMVIEAVFEDLSLKQSIFEDIEKFCSSDCIFASNTSTIDPRLIGERTNSHDRILGLHLFSPAHVMPLAEIIRTESTSAKVIFDVLKFTKQIRKHPIIVKNTPCFAANRIFIPYMEAADLLANLGVDIFRIDRVMREFGMRIGPFQLWDVSGYGVYLAGLQVFIAAYGSRSFLSPLLRLMLENGRAGKNNGRGFYLYEAGSKPKPDPSVLQVLEESRKNADIIPDGKLASSVSDEEIMEMMFFPVVNEACRLVDEGIVVQASDIDVASIRGLSFPSYYGGILHWGDGFGAEYICSKLTAWSEINKFFKPSTSIQKRAAQGFLLSAASFNCP